MYIKLANVVEDSYPGIVKKLFVVNSKYIFKQPFRISL